MRFVSPGKYILKNTMEDCYRDGVQLYYHDPLMYCTP